MITDSTHCASLKGSTSQSRWDEKIQQYHGGQEWSEIKEFVDDFSVTTNCFGTPESGLKVLMNSVRLNDFHGPPS
jgi:hypothetical protein